MFKMISFGSFGTIAADLTHDSDDNIFSLGCGTPKRIPSEICLRDRN